MTASDAELTVGVAGAIRGHLAEVSRGEEQTVTVEYLLLDLPSDHEVEEGVVTECDVVRAVVSNKGHGKKVKTIRAATVDGFTRRRRPTTSVKYVHLAGHGNSAQLGLIGGGVCWADVAEQISTLVPKLRGKQQRVLCISCCFSASAAREMYDRLVGRFSAVYHFDEDKIKFYKAMTVWSMFYCRKTLDRPHQAIVDSVNEFFGSEVLVFKPVATPATHAKIRRAVRLIRRRRVRPAS